MVQTAEKHSEIKIHPPVKVPGAIPGATTREREHPG